MSMNPESKNFEELRRLLALKRHEQPPPGYFNDFSSQIIGRIRAGDRADEAFGAGSFWQVPWLQRFWSAMEAKPVFAGGFAVAACGMLLAGFFYSETPDTTGANYITPMSQEASGLRMAQSPPSRPLLESANVSGNSDVSSISPISTSLSGGSLFEEIQKARSLNSLQPQALRATYSVTGN